MPLCCLCFALASCNLNTALSVLCRTPLSSTPLQFEAVLLLSAFGSTQQPEDPGAVAECCQ